MKRQALQAALYSCLLLFSFSLSSIAQEKPAEEKSSQGRAKAEKTTNPLLQARGRLQKIFQGQAPRDAHDVKAMQKHVQLLIEKLSPATVGVGV